MWISGKALALRPGTPAAGTRTARRGGDGERTRLPCPPFQRPAMPQAQPPRPQRRLRVVTVVTGNESFPWHCGRDRRKHGLGSVPCPVPQGPTPRPPRSRRFTNSSSVGSAGVGAAGSKAFPLSSLRCPVFSPIQEVGARPRQPQEGCHRAPSMSLLLSLNQLKPVMAILLSWFRC